jgi:hypothetical protein
MSGCDGSPNGRLRRSTNAVRMPTDLAPMQSEARLADKENLIRIEARQLGRLDIGRHVRPERIRLGNGDDPVESDATALVRE